MVLTSAPIAEDGEMSSPRAGGPSRRRSFTPAQKLHHLAEYETACENGQGGAYLRREGLYSSLISEWRRLRDAGLLCQGPLGSAQGRSWDLPGDGHEFCPVMAMGSAQRLAITGPRGQVNGLTP